MNSDIYLETTAVLDAVFKSFPEVGVIIDASKKKYTSQYVKMEIKRGFLNYLTLMYNRLVQTENWSDFLQYISNLTRRPYQLGAILDALTKFTRMVEKQRPSELIKKHGDISHSEIEKRDTESFLRLWIRSLLRKIEKSVDDVLNPMGCFVDIKSPQIQKGIFVSKPYKCPESSFECGIKNFFSENAGDFTKILKKLKNIPPHKCDAETKKRITSLNKILNKFIRHNRDFSNYAQNHELCWNCGDAIHAVIAPIGSSVVNRNERHFNPICEAIDKKSLTYKSPKSK